MNDNKVNDTVDLSDLRPAKGSRRRRKRKGIGEGSGNGKTCGKGGKGQSMRSGYSLPRGFEGGQMPLHRRLPKVGFTSRKKVLGKNVFSLISIAALQQFEAEGEITLELLRSKGMVKAASKVKILGGGELTKKIVVEAHAVSASAKSAIEAAGGEVRLVGER